MGIDTKILKEMILEFQSSKELKNIINGKKYYNGKHNILNKKLNEYTIFDQKTNRKIKKLNENKSNQRIAHPFHQKLVNQKIRYCCAKPITIKYNPLDNDNDEEKKKIVDIVWNQLEHKFENKLKNIAKDASNCGRAWLHPTYKNGRLEFKKYSSDEIIPIYDTETQEDLIGVIHFYDIQDLSGDKPTTKIYVEYWDELGVTYYEEEKIDNNTIFIEDVTRPKNDFHYTTTVFDKALNNIKRIEKHSWGRVPFIEVSNNEEKTTDLEGIKNLIDAYDLINSNFVNTVEDLKEIVWLVNGYGAEDLLSYIEGIKVNGVARTNDAMGKIDAKTIQIPYEARKILLEMLRNLIFEFGCGVDTSNHQLIGNAPSGVALGFLYTDLDSKCDDLICGLKTALYDVLWYVLEDLKNQGKISKDVNEFDFGFEFNKTKIFNEIEIVKALNSDTTLSKKRKLELHPWVEDVEAEIEQIESESKENIKKQQQIFGTNEYLDNNIDEE